MTKYEALALQAIRESGLSQKDICRILRISQGNASKKLSGSVGLSVNDLNALALAGVEFPPLGTEISE